MPIPGKVSVFSFEGFFVQLSVVNFSGRVNLVRFVGISLSIFHEIN
jgi:hypothetical protein